MANCTKIKYPNRWAATQALHAITLKNAQSALKSPVAIHGCQSCQALHLTSQKPRGTRSRGWNALVG